MANKLIKKCSISLVSTEMQTKTTDDILKAENTKC